MGEENKASLFGSPTASFPRASDNEHTPRFIYLHLPACCEQVRALGNIAGDSPLSRDMVLQQGALSPLLQQLTDRSKLSMLRKATWALSKFCVEISPPRLEKVSAALPTLVRLMYSVDREVSDSHPHPLIAELFCFCCPPMRGACGAAYSELVLFSLVHNVCVGIVCVTPPSITLGNVSYFLRFTN